MRRGITQIIVTTYGIQSKDVPCLPRLEKTFPGGTQEKRSWPESSRDQGMSAMGMDSVAEGQGQPAALERTYPVSELFK